MLATALLRTGRWTHVEEEPFAPRRRRRRAFGMTEKPTRIEKDSMGAMTVPANARHGASTHRALDARRRRAVRASPASAQSVRHDRKTDADRKRFDGRDDGARECSPRRFYAPGAGRASKKSRSRLAGVGAERSA